MEEFIEIHRDPNSCRCKIMLMALFLSTTGRLLFKI